MTPVRAVLCRNVVPIIVVVNSQLNVAIRKKSLLSVALQALVSRPELVWFVQALIIEHACSIIHIDTVPVCKQTAECTVN